MRIVGRGGEEEEHEILTQTKVFLFEP